MKRNKNRRIRRGLHRPSADYKKLEDRICLTVSASVTQTGSLSVRGAADGLVEIVAVAPETFRVTDNGVEIATLDRVRRNIAVKLREGPLNDTVRINLQNQAVENVVVELHDGRNDFRIDGNRPIQRVVYRGGNGADTVVTNVDTATITAIFGFDGLNNYTAQNNSLRFRYRGGAQADLVDFGNVQTSWMGVILGDGNNVMDSAATISRQQFVRGGAQKDTITTADFSATSSFDLGGGSNVLNVDGNYQRLFLRGSNGQDTIFFDTSSVVSTRLGVDLGGGNNFMRLAGNRRYRPVFQRH